MTGHGTGLTRRGAVRAMVGGAVAGGLALPALRRASAQGAPIRVGAVFALSGPGEPVGTALLRGAQVAVALCNRAGGVGGRPVELVVRDDKYNGAASVTAVRDLAGSGVKLIVGGSQTVTALAAVPILPEVDAVLVSPAAAGMSITHELFNKRVFRLTSNTYTLYRCMGRALAEKNPGVRDWAIVAPEGEYGRGFATYVRSGLEEYLPKVANGATAHFADPIFVSATATDYKVAINALLGSGAQGVALGVVGAPQITFLQQARAAGLFAKVKVIGDGGNELVTAKALQKNLPEGFWSVSYGSTLAPPFTQRPMVRDIQAEYVRMNGDASPPGLVLTGHRSALALLKGMEKARSAEPAAVAAAMAGMEFESATGPYRIRAEDHQGLGDDYFARIGPVTEAPFYAIGDVVGIPESEMVEPPAPGTAFAG